MATRKRTGPRGSAAGSQARGNSAAAFTGAVGEGLKRLGKSRENAEKRVRDALEAAQGSMQSRLDGAREQAGETWDNLELLFQTRVQRAMQQIGVPTAEEIRLLTRRVGELNEAVKTLTIKVEGGRRMKPAPTRQRTSKKAGRTKAAPRKAKASRG